MINPYASLFLQRTNGKAVHHSDLRERGRMDARTHTHFGMVQGKPASSRHCGHPFSAVPGGALAYLGVKRWFIRYHLPTLYLIEFIMYMCGFRAVGEWLAGRAYKRIGCWCKLPRNLHRRLDFIQSVKLIRLQWEMIRIEDAGFVECAWTISLNTPKCTFQPLSLLQIK